MWDFIVRIVVIILLLLPSVGLAFAIWSYIDWRSTQKTHELVEMIHLEDGGHHYYAVKNGGHTYWFESLDAKRIVAVEFKLAQTPGPQGEQT